MRLMDRGLHVGIERGQDATFCIEIAKDRLMLPVRLEAEDNLPAIPREQLMHRMVRVLAVRTYVNAPHLFAQQAHERGKDIDCRSPDVRSEIVDAR